MTSYEGRKRPGKTLQGFQKALSRVPMRQLWALAPGVRDQIRLRYAERLLVDGFEPMGCDGSRIECPRSAELEARLGKRARTTRPRLPGSRPSCIWRPGCCGRGNWAKEPPTNDYICRRLLATLAAALIVADAAYHGL